MPIDQDGYWVDDSQSSSSSHVWQPWSSWEEVPDEVPDWATGWFIFLEIFAGKAGVTRAVRSEGTIVLPPVDIVLSKEVVSVTNLEDEKVWQKIDKWITSGVIDLVHFGTPCSSFSRARKDDGGPRPLRSEEFPGGLPAVFLGEYGQDDLNKLTAG